jgi:hypothetical protein
MSSPSRSPSPDVLSPTRQQLDELDSLIQQMLTLPVNPLGSETFVGADPFPMPAGAPDEATRPAELPKLPEPFAQPVPDPFLEGSANARAAEVLPAVATPPEPPPPRRDPTNRVEFKSTRKDHSAAGVRRWGRPLLLPLVWANCVFDGFTYLLGPPGRWLRGEAGRAFLGWMGMALLAGAAGWALLDWMGWI